MEISWPVSWYDKRSHSMDVKNSLQLAFPLADFRDETTLEVTHQKPWMERWLLICWLDRSLEINPVKTLQNHVKFEKSVSTICWNHCFIMFLPFANHWNCSVSVFFGGEWQVTCMATAPPPFRSPIFLWHKIGNHQSLQAFKMSVLDQSSGALGGLEVSMVQTL